jgi:hypothetical protein
MLAVFVDPLHMFPRAVAPFIPRDVLVLYTSQHVYNYTFGELKNTTVLNIYLTFLHKHTIEEFKYINSKHITIVNR